MIQFIESLLRLMDKATEAGSRHAARQYGRRSVLAKTGAALIGGALLPMLPFDRTGGSAFAAEGEDETTCDYWRYCALDGNLCNTSGGTTTACPPGSSASKVSWVGTCRNPNDNKDYLVSYNDCCGKASVSGSTFCFTSERERPGYRMGLYNDINWCMANTDKGYHCTVAVLVGVADE
ncbi:methylamine dehydrogenase light chain [Pararhizobium capsulatum DSM 1112]|uniref:Methylamine dehydrogenase light chain n=1 Tax=Pararhizobium capsulatum DSM 1112 TaxID=1121113 RepID=A0ABU0BYK0_9HYPH|nr:methylamine dehydrogenase light chain [Pararhizobium capsulatum]MDQ0322731.1 methylamine dehydrogenase light chain [Pararhizobium capsulatum DSM 1112]